ncbi:SICA antigen [Plasmodium coatneyi]|uniref:SICA antigen n=1 Tax=Plasmodium coatneyi TaxID=208452 RepID=A0A1B1DXN4_9APIC|nr:SICA antigen [Plasmodium coatneyi]ANQ07542.1 SICA antigen [Plasmodium coatneyi]
MAPSIRDFIKFHLGILQRHKDEDAGEQLWKNLKRMLDALPGYMNYVDPTVQTLCEKDFMKGQLGDSHNWDEALCKSLVKIFLWMNGRNQHLRKQKKGGEGGTEIDDMELMFRCIAGNAAIWAMFGDHCQLNSMIDYATEAVSGVLQAFDGDGTVRKCGDHTFKEQKVGTQLLGDKVKDWVKSNWYNIQDYWNVSREQRDLCKEGKNSSHGRNEEGADDIILQTVTGYTGKEMQEVKEIIEKEEFVDKKSVNEIVEKIEKDELVDDVSIERKVEEKVEERKAAVAAAAKSNDPCELVKIVTDKWFTNRDHKESDKKWSTIQKNVEGQWRSLLEKITVDDGHNDQYCNDAARTGNTLNGAEKKACQYITKGLRHISEIKEEEGDQKNKADNQKFKQTMACVALNVFAKKLKEQNLTCSVSAGIDHAFNKSSELKTACTGSGCMECKLGDYSKCSIRDQELGPKLNEMLQQNDDKIQKTLTTIRNATTLCQRANCAATNWFNDRNGNEKQTWCTFWDVDAKSRLKELSEGITKEKEDSNISSLCGNTDGRNTIITDTEKKACGFIIAGLKYLYSIMENNDEKNRVKARNNRLTEQTMGCLFLNAFADKLIQELKRPCYITEKDIEDMFAKGNKKIDDWCKHKVNGKGDCFVCTRDPNYKNCTLNVNEDLFNENESGNCEIGKDSNGANIGDKVEKVFEEGEKDIKKGPKIKEALTALADINKNNVSLCNRVKCIYYRWGENRKDSGNYPDGEKFWNPDVETRLKNLSEAITKKNGIDASLCKNIQDGKSGPTSEEGKKACELIVKGLKHIYEIKKGTDGEQQKIEDDLIFHRTFSCIFLNIYADLLIEKNKNCITEPTIKNAFEIGNKKMSEWCTDNVNGDCVKCERESGYKDCRIKEGDSGTIGDRMEEMLDPQKNKDPKKQEIKQAMEAINKICPDPPVAVKPSTAAKPVAAKPAAIKLEVKDNCTIEGLEDDEEGMV